MTKRKIYFRADASATIGYGHFVRTLALADMLKDDFECTFFTTSPSAYQIGEMVKVCAFVALNEDTKFEAFLNLLTGDEIVVLDNYFFTTQYMQQIKDKGCKLVCMGDTKRFFVCDAIINHAIPSSDAFKVVPYTKMYLGFDYALLRKPFLECKHIAKENNHWFVSFGGTDYDNMTAKFVDMLDTNPTVRSITIVIGDAYKYRKTLESYSKAKILNKLSAIEMQMELSKAEYAIIPSSTVCIEALACGCKVISGYFVDNQVDFYNVLKSNHSVYPLGDLHEVIDSTFIAESHKYDYNMGWKFSDIPSRYKHIFENI